MNRGKADSEIFMMFFKLRIFFAGLAFAGLTASAQAPVRTIVDFNAEWKFLQSDPAHAEDAAFDDSGWSAVSVPHDWSIAGPVDEKNLSGQGGGYFSCRRCLVSQELFLAREGRSSSCLCRL